MWQLWHSSYHAVAAYMCQYLIIGILGRPLLHGGLQRWKPNQFFPKVELRFTRNENGELYLDPIADTKVFDFVWRFRDTTLEWNKCVAKHNLTIETRKWTYPFLTFDERLTIFWW